MPELKPFAERAHEVLDFTYRGIYHCNKITKKYAGTRNEQWETNHYGELSTFDFDLLTRLVISAHDNCVRAVICSSGPNMVKIRLTNRISREGDIFDRHPTIEQAIQTARRAANAE